MTVHEAETRWKKKGVQDHTTRGSSVPGCWRACLVGFSLSLKLFHMSAQLKHPSTHNSKPETPKPETPTYCTLLYSTVLYCKPHNCPELLF